MSERTCELPLYPINRSIRSIGLGAQSPLHPPTPPYTHMPPQHALVEGDEEVGAGVPQRQVHLVLVHLLLARLHRCGLVGL